MKNLQLNLIIVFLGVFIVGILGGCKVYGKTNKTVKKEDPNIVKGEIVVGFEKEVTKEEAETVLVKYKLKFTRTNDVNMGKAFFYETGEKFIVTVPKGKETYWLKKLKKEKGIKLTGQHYDPLKIIID